MWFLLPYNESGTIRIYISLSQPIPNTVLGHVTLHVCICKIMYSYIHTCTGKLPS